MLARSNGKKFWKKTKRLGKACEKTCVQAESSHLDSTPLRKIYIPMLCKQGGRPLARQQTAPRTAWSGKSQKIWSGKSQKIWSGKSQKI
jgi:hypothetical protein